MVALDFDRTVTLNVLAVNSVGEIRCDLWKTLGKAASSYVINFESGGIQGLCGGKTNY